MKVESWLRRHPVCSFFVLAFGISWGGILVVMGAAGFNLVELRPLDTSLIFVFRVCCWPYRCTPATRWLFVLYPATSLQQGLVWQTGFALALWVRWRWS